MKVLLISPGDLPVPAVDGGAVETLMESIMKMNSVEGRLQLEIFSTYDDKAKEKSKDYKNVSFIWWRMPNCLYFIDKLIDFILLKINKVMKPKNYLRKLYVVHQIKKLIQKSEFDFIVIENAGYILKAFRNHKKSNLYYYLHNDIPRNADKKVLMDIKYILVSEYLKKGIMQHIGKSHIEDSFVVKNGINTDKLLARISEKEKRKLRGELELPLEKKIVLFVGRINEEKGIKELLEAMLISERTDVLLVIVGSTNFGLKEKSKFEIDVEQKCRRLASKVKLTGFVHNSELWKYYKCADVAVLPSVWEEPAGLTMVEACAAAVPLITTDKGGIPEYINSKYSIVLNSDLNLPQKINNALDQVLANLDLWREKSKLAQEYVKNNFSEKRYYDEFVNIFYNNSKEDENENDIFK